MKHGHGFRSTRISVRVILAFLGLVLFQGIISIIGVSWIIQRANEESFENEIRRTVDSVRAYTDDAIRDIKVKTSLLAGQKKVIDYTDYSLYNLLSQELSLFRLPMRIDAISVLRPDSSIVAYSGEAYVVRLAETHSIVRNFLEGIPIFLLNIENRMYLWVVSPILREKIPIGYLASAIQLDRTFLRPLEVAVGARVMFSLKNQAFVSTGLLDRITIHILERYYKKELTSQSDISGRIGSLVYKATVIPSLPELYAYCFIDTAEYHALFRQYTYFSIGFLFLVIIMATILAILFYRVTFFVPLGLFMYAVQKIASGDLSYRIDTTMEDEFGDLALAFEDMMEKIRIREQRIKELGNYNALILENVPAGIMTFDLENRLSAYNEKFTQLTNLPLSTASIGQAYNQIGLPVQLEQVLTEVFREKRYVSFKELILDCVSDKKIFSLTLVPLLSEGKEEVGTLLVLLDITKEKELEKKLALSSRMAAVGEMVAGVAHQLRNPLAVMKMSFELLQERLDAEAIAKRDPETKKLLQAVIYELDTMGKVVSNFLDFTRPFFVHKQETNIAVFLKEVCSSFQKEGPRVSLRIVVDVPKGFYSFDPILIGQALRNLIQNAIDASRDGSEVYLRAFQEENSLVLEVEDHGLGIPDEVMKRIFEPFYTTKTHGTGLGLSIVHRIMDMHGKKFELFTKPGEGTRVRLLL